MIPAGGIGSRLWPLSRADAPKFLHDLTGSGQTLLRDTWDRSAPLSGPDRIAVVTGRAHRAAVERELPGHRRPQRDPRVGAARLGGGDRTRRGDPVPSRARGDHRLVRRRSRDPRNPHFRVGRSAGGRGCPGGLHLHDRNPAHRAVRRIRLHQEGRRAARRRRSRGGARRDDSSRSPTSRRQGVFRRPVLPVERRHVHLSRRRAARRDRREPARAARRARWSWPRRGTTAKRAALSSTACGRR